jgi:YCII-related domain
MAKYLLLYSGGSMPETEAEQAEVMKAWDSWFHELGGALADGGNPFSPAATKIASDGSTSDAAGQASGYSIIEADSLDAATAMAKGCPVLQGGAAITVFETFNVM